MTSTFRRILGCGLTLLSGVCAQPAGRITGAVVDDAGGRPLAGATVMATQRTAKGTPVILRAVSASNGAYEILGAPPGVFSLCVHDAGEYLNPCEWSAPVPALADGAPQQIRLQRGVFVAVHVDDPKGHASASSAVKQGSPVAVTVTDASGRVHLVNLTSGMVGGYRYSHLVWPAAAMTVRVSSDAFLLADRFDSPIDERGQAFAVTTPSLPSIVELPPVRMPFMGPYRGPHPTVITVKIRGKKAP